MVGREGHNMKNYLSFGGGVNSVALYLHMQSIGMDFEAVFVDHGGDLPETYDYVKMFSAKYPLTILKAQVHRKKSNKTWDSIVDFCDDQKKIPQQWPRWCTGDWKKDQVNKYIKKPCYMMIGIDAGEASRAKIQTNGGIEYRYPLIEAEIDRQGCKYIIIDHGLPVPPKSGCYICPFQSSEQIKQLRRKHPELFCKVKRLEKQSGRTLRKGFPVDMIVNEKQMSVFDVDEYPPCQCGL
jgi:hypothetical protein